MAQAANAKAAPTAPEMSQSMGNLLMVFQAMPGIVPNVAPTDFMFSAIKMIAKTIISRTTKITAIPTNLNIVRFFILVLLSCGNFKENFFLQLYLL